jgi:hypothetical protein
MRSWIGRHVSPATVIAAVALVFAMAGGAYAAKRYVITSTGQISPKALRALSGKAGPKGAAGATGSQGSAGAQGPAGPQGPAGKDGANGANGKDGVNGERGPQGPEGKAGQTGFTEKLPSGKTETGTWAINEYGPLSEEKDIFVPISFPIPTSSGEGFYLNQGETEEAPTTKPHGCEGTLAQPTAPKGKLCIYTEEPEETSKVAVEVFTQGELGHFGASGGFLEFAIKAGGQAVVRGSWAVTAP